MLDVEWIVDLLQMLAIEAYRDQEYHLSHRMLTMLSVWEGNSFLAECQFLCLLQYQNKPWVWRGWKPRHAHDPILPRDYDEFFEEGWLTIARKLEDAPLDGSVFRWTDTGNVLKLLPGLGSIDTGDQDE